MYKMLRLRRRCDSIMINTVVFNPVVLILATALIIVWSYYFWCLFGKCIKYACFHVLQVQLLHCTTFILALKSSGSIYFIHQCKCSRTRSINQEIHFSLFCHVLLGWMSLFRLRLSDINCRKSNWTIVLLKTHCLSMRYWRPLHFSSNSIF